MSLKGWYSKKDVIKDLSKATGAVCDLDEEYVVVGERPPPYLRTMDDGKSNIFFRIYLAPPFTQITLVIIISKGPCLTAIQ